MDYKDLLQTHFNLEITELSLLDSHFGTEIYLAKTKHEKLFVKKLPSYMTQVANEKAVTDFLAGKGMKVPTPVSYTHLYGYTGRPQGDRALRARPFLRAPLFFSQRPCQHGRFYD